MAVFATASPAQRHRYAPAVAGQSDTLESDQARPRYQREPCNRQRVSDNRAPVLFHRVDIYAITSIWRYNPMYIYVVIHSKE